MQVALYATVAGVIALTGIYLHKKRKQRQEDERVVERLDSIAVRGRT